MPDSDTLERTRFNFHKAIPVFEEWLRIKEADADEHLESAIKCKEEDEIVYWSSKSELFHALRHCWSCLTPPQRRDMLRTIWQAMEQAR